MQFGELSFDMHFCLSLSLPFAVIKGVGFRFEQEDCRGRRKVVVCSRMLQTNNCLLKSELYFYNLTPKDRYVTVRRFRGLESQ